MDLDPQTQSKGTHQICFITKSGNNVTHPVVQVVQKCDCTSANLSRIYVLWIMRCWCLQRSVQQTESSVSSIQLPVYEEWPVQRSTWTLQEWIWTLRHKVRHWFNFNWLDRIWRIEDFFFFFFYQNTWEPPFQNVNTNYELQDMKSLL